KGLLLGLELLERVDDGGGDRRASAPDAVGDHRVEVAAQACEVAVPPGPLRALAVDVVELAEDALTLLDLTDGQDAERRLDAVGGDPRVDGAGERVGGLVVDVTDERLDPGVERGRLHRDLGRGAL